ncbi:MAG: ATP phosphoribosyltransferase regulatory subunit [Pseudomonadota bacterium]
MKDSNTALLPNGLQDLLFPEAEKEAGAIHTLMMAFKAFGYQRVKPPLVEFEESLLSGPGQALTRQTFRLMDPVSQRMMGVRADATAQISRIASSRLAAEDRPLRFSYAADVLRVNGTQLRPERQFCQVGCELIGDASIRADVEIMLIALKALTDLGIKDITIDLTIPTLVESVFEAHHVDEDEKDNLREALSRRDFEAFDMTASELHQIMAQLLSCVGPVSDNLETLKSIAVPEQSAESIVRLDAVITELQSALDVYGLSDVNVTIDAVEHKGFEYHKGISFTLFAKGLRGELGSGGRYESNDETATGFTIYMDTVLRALPTHKSEDKEFVSSDEDWKSIKSKQKSGKMVIRKG